MSEEEERLRMALHAYRSAIEQIVQCTTLTRNKMREIARRAHERGNHIIPRGTERNRQTMINEAMRAKHQS